MASLDTIRTLTLKFKTEGEEEAARKMDDLARSTKGLVSSTEQTEKSTAQAGRAWKRYEAVFDPLAKSVQQYERVQRAANVAVAIGETTRERANEVMGLAQQRVLLAARGHEELAKATGKAGNAQETMAKQTTLARHEMINLSRQAQDVAVSLAGGQSPLTVLFQQGSQIADVFTSSKASVGDALKGIGANAAAAAVRFGPLIAAGAAVAGSAVAINRMFDQRLEARQATTGGLGRLGSLRPNDVAETAERSRAVGVSLEEARQGVLAFAKAGVQSNEVIEEGNLLAQRYATTIGTDLVSAQKELAQFSAAPSKNIDQLNAKTGAFTAGFVQHVKDMESTGNRVGAVTQSLQLLGKSLVSDADATANLTKFWKELETRVDRGGQTVAGLLTRVPTPDLPAGPTTGDLRLARSRSSPPAVQAASIDEMQATANAKALDTVSRAAEQYKQEQAAVDEAIRKTTEAHALEVAGIQAVTDAERAGVAVTKTFLDVKEKTGRDDIARSAAMQAGEKVLTTSTQETENSTRAKQAEIAVIQAEIDMVGKAAAVRAAYVAQVQAKQELNLKGKDPNTPESKAFIDKSKDAATAQQTLNDTKAIDAMTRSHEANMLAIQARTQAEVEAAAGAKAYAAAISSQLGPQAASTASTYAAAEAKEADAAASRQTQRQSAAQLQSIRAVTIAEHASAAAAVAASQQKIGSIEGEAAAQAASAAVNEKYNSEVRSHIQDQRDAIEVQQLEAQMIGATEQARAAAIAGLKEEQAIRREGKSVLSQDSEERIRNSQTIAANKAALDEAAKAAARFAAAFAKYSAEADKVMESGHSASLDIGNTIGYLPGAGIAMTVDASLGKPSTLQGTIPQFGLGSEAFGGHGHVTAGGGPGRSGSYGFPSSQVLSTFVPDAEGQAFYEKAQNAPKVAELQKQLQFAQSGGPGDAIVSPLKRLIEGLTDQVKSAANDNADPMANASKSDPRLDPYLSRQASVYYGTATDQFYKEISWQDATLNEAKTQTTVENDQLAQLQAIATNAQAMAANTDPSKVAQYIAQGLRDSGFVKEAAEVMKQASVYALQNQIDKLSNPDQGAVTTRKFSAVGSGGASLGAPATSTYTAPTFSPTAFMAPHATGADMILPGSGGEQPYLFSAQPGERLRITPKGGEAAPTVVQNTTIYGVNDPAQVADELMRRSRSGMSKAAQRAAGLGRAA